MGNPGQPGVGAPGQPETRNSGSAYSRPVYGATDSNEMLALKNTFMRQPCSPVHAIAEFLNDPLEFETNWVECGCCLPDTFESQVPKTDVLDRGAPIWYWARRDRKGAAASCALRFTTEKAWTESLQAVASTFVNSYEAGHDWFDKDLSELHLINGSHPLNDLSVAWLVGKQFMPTISEQSVLSLPGVCPAKLKLDRLSCVQPEQPPKPVAGRGLMALLDIQTFVKGATGRMLYSVFSSWVQGLTGKAQESENLIGDVPGLLHNIISAVKELTEIQHSAVDTVLRSKSSDTGGAAWWSSSGTNENIDVFDTWQFPCWQDGVGSFVRSPKMLEDATFLVGEVFEKLTSLQVEEADVELLIKNCYRESSTLLDALGLGKRTACVMHLFNACDSGLASRVLSLFAVSHRSTQAILHMTDAWWSAQSAWCINNDVNELMLSKLSPRARKRVKRQLSSTPRKCS
jgi:hypothetical protein